MNKYTFSNNGFIRYFQVIFLILFITIVIVFNVQIANSLYEPQWPNKGIPPNFVLEDHATKNLNLQDVSQSTPESQSVFYVLYSDAGGLYAYSPFSKLSTYISFDLPIPKEFMATNPNEIFFEQNQDFPDLPVTVGYELYSAIISSSGEDIVYTEAVCDEKSCDSTYNVWLFSKNSNNRVLLFDDSSEFGDLIPQLIAWDIFSDGIIFETNDTNRYQVNVGIWRYAFGSQRIEKIDMGGNNSFNRIWISPDNRYLLTTGYNETKTNKAWIDVQPSSIIKMYDLLEKRSVIIADNPSGQDYYYVRGWINENSLKNLVDISNRTIPGNSTLSIPEATSGFQRPYPYTNYGYEWLEWTGYVYHPGYDLNGPDGGDTDCGDDIYAVANGTVRYVNTGSWGGIVVEHLWQGITVYSQYGHVSYSFVVNGQNVTKGQHIAEMGKVGTNIVYCHLHWEIREADHPNPTYGAYWDSSVLSNLSSTQAYYEDPEWWVANHGSYSTDCPESGGVILYKNANFDCGGQGIGDGYIIKNNVGWENVPTSFNDQASSIRIPSGWSVRLFEHSERAGASVCRSSDDSDFAGDFFDGGSISLNDQISSFEVFSQTNCSSSSLPPDGYLFCANENGRCEFRGIGTVAYGANGQFTYVNNISDGVDCNNDIFGDPVPGVPKSCYVRITSLPYFEFCANENGTCEIDGKGDIAYGANGLYAFQYNVMNEIACTNTIFGDPILGTAKSCYLRITSPTAPTLIFPSNGERLNTTTDITLDWDTSSGATLYYVELWGGPSININSGWIGNTYWNIGTLWQGTYNWRVKAKCNYGESDWSPTWTFIVDEPTAQAVDVWTSDENWNIKSTFDPGDLIKWVITVDNSTGKDTDITLDYLVLGPSGETIHSWNGMVTTPSGIIFWGLPGTIPTGVGGTHTFIGRVTYQSDETEDTTTYFVTGPTDPPSVFNKIIPTDGSFIFSTNSTLVWETSSPIFNYEYCYDTTDDNSCSYWIDNGNSPSVSISDLVLGNTYYWHVRAKNTGGVTYSNGSEFAFWKFTTSSGFPVYLPIVTK